MTAEEGGDPVPASSWVDNYVASYRYGRQWLTFVFPVFGLLSIYEASTSRSGIAIAVLAGVGAIVLLVCVEYRTYIIRINRNAISRGSLWHAKAFSLNEVDLVQHIFDGDNNQFLYVRHSDRILLKISQELVGFDDLVGFFREYARHHHLIFATRDGFGEWTQAGGTRTDNTSSGAE
jgi:hypothetical protein